MKFTLAPHALDEALPLIYMWEIEDASGALVGRYVGKAKGGARRPFKHYSRNVANILSDRPYRLGKPEGYRRVHRALAEAARCGHAVRLTFLCNVEPHEDINGAEQDWIKKQRSRGSLSWQLNG